ncbi:MAG: hypothetical protein JWO85_3606, partial [Candidatus Eremiobacteraeota bacterium]|nr:hypothetical protein [Candidatus Eremiobacteraeota bacterium]
MPLHARAAIARFAGAVLAMLFIAISLVGPASAATTGTISGTVTDAATKKPVPGAVVTASAPSGRASATADANGFFNLNGLAPDTYTVLISTKGYQDVAIAGVTVVQDQ